MDNTRLQERFSYRDFHSAILGKGAPSENSYNTRINRLGSDGPNAATPRCRESYAETKMSGGMVGGVFGRIGGIRPGKLLAHCAHDVVCNFRPFQQRVLGPKLAADHATRLTE